MALRGPRPPSAKHDVSTTTGTGTETACHERDAVACPIRTRGEARNRWTDRDSSEEKIGGGGGNRTREPEVPLTPYPSPIARNAAEERAQAEVGGAGNHARVRIWRRASAKPCHSMVAAFGAELRLDHGVVSSSIACDGAAGTRSASAALSHDCFHTKRRPAHWLTTGSNPSNICSGAGAVGRRRGFRMALYSGNERRICMLAAAACLLAALAPASARAQSCAPSNLQINHDADLANDCAS